MDLQPLARRQNEFCPFAESHVIAFLSVSVDVLLTRFYQFLQVSPWGL